MFNPHDFALTASHYVFFHNAMTFAMGPYLFGWKGPAQCVTLADKPMRAYVVPRSGDSAPVEVEIPDPAYLIHHANGFEDGDEVVVWSSGWGPPAVRKLIAKAKAKHKVFDPLQVFDRDPGSGILGAWDEVMTGDFSSVPHTQLWEHRINKLTGEATRKVMFEQMMDHPRVNPLFYSRPTRFVYFNMGGTGLAGTKKPSPPQSFCRLDTLTGEAQSWSPGPRGFCEELIFVPGPDGASREDSGYLLGMVFDAAANRSSLVVLDAADFSKGPVARLHLKHQLPHGLHGQWADEIFI
jgi:all-trans-8'-apo-beta-carotenal 15,15'-oxygenase